MPFAIILIEHTPKTCLKSIHQLKTTLWWFFAMNIGPLVSIKRKERSMSNCEKTEICHFVHNFLSSPSLVVPHTKEAV